MAHSLSDMTSFTLSRWLWLRKNLLAITRLLGNARRLGMQPNRLELSAFGISPNDELLVDLSGIDAGRRHSSLHSSVALHSSSAPSDVADDVFGLGVVLAFALVGVSPAEWRRTADLHWVAEQIRLRLPELHQADEIATGIHFMLLASPDQRPDLETVLEWLKEWEPRAAGNQSVTESSLTLGIRADDLIELEMSDIGELTEAGQASVEPKAAVANVGRRLGRFNLEASLGKGAAGQVFKAYDGLSERYVAVKVLRPEMCQNAEVLQRFKREAKLLSACTNPYIAELIEANEDGDVHYIVMEYVNGRSLDILLRENGPFPERQAFAIMCDVARGLGVAHDRGIVHRDIKPSNVMLISSDNTSDITMAKLIDFGVARSFDGEATLELTQVGSVVGTPYYMAPE